jgi:hypothetical protein
MKPKYAVIGDPGKLAIAIEEQLELVPFQAAGASGLNGILISRGVTPTFRELQDYLAAGLPLAVAQPDPDLCAALLQATGVGTGPADLALYTPADGSYHVSTVHSSGSQVFDAEASAPLASPDWPLSVPADFFATGTAPPLAVGEAIDELLPRNVSGAAVGRMNISVPIDSLYSAPFGCDKRMKDRGGQQKIDGNYRTDVFAYWADGREEANPYFVVIARQNLRFNPAAFQASDKITPIEHMLTWEGETRGLFMTMLDLKPLTFQVEICDDFAAVDESALTNWRNAEKEKGEVISLDTIEPHAASAQDGQAVRFDYPAMSLRINDQSGARSQSYAFTPRFVCNDMFRSWRCLNRASGIEPAWRFHQYEVWDPNDSPPNDWVNWHRNMYDASQGNHVKPMPEQSRTTLSVNTMSAWKIDTKSKSDPPGSAPRPYPVRVKISGGFKGLLAAIHMRDACNLPNGHHLGCHYPERSFEKWLLLRRMCDPGWV